jgi:hypothetical protein
MLVIWCCVQVLMCLHQNQWLFKGFFCRLHAIFLFLLIFFSKVRIMISQKMIVISSEPRITAICQKMFFSSLGYGHWIEAKHLWEVANRNFQMIKSNVKSGQRKFPNDTKAIQGLCWTSHHVEEVSLKSDQEKLSNVTKAIQKDGDGGSPGEIKDHLSPWFVCSLLSV